MKKLIKKISIVLMIISILGAYFSAFTEVFAESNVAEIKIYDLNGNLKFRQTYTSYNQAVLKLNAEAKSGQKVVIDFFNDFYVDTRITIKEKARVEMNLNGHVFSRVGVKQRNGEVIYVGENAELTINGGEDKSIEHTISYTEDSNCNRDKTTTIKGGAISGGHSTNSAGGIFAKKNSKIVLNDVSISGNISNGEPGGGITMDGPYINLTMNNSTISYNYAGDYGGGIYVYGSIIFPDAEHCTVRMNNSHIDHNTSGSGAGILVDAEWFNLIGDAKVNYSLRNKEQANELKGSTISWNDGATGAGIGFFEDNCTVSGINFVGNYGSKGGACILNGENISISNCTIIGNEAWDSGGAIYDNNDDNSISNCCIMYNNAKSKKTGGVYVTGTCDIILSGLIYIKENTAPEKPETANFNLDWFDYQESYIIGNPDPQSDIHINPLNRSDDNVRNICEKKGTYNANIYTSDNPEYFIGWDRDGDRMLKRYNTRDYNNKPDQKAYLMGRSNAETVTIDSNHRVLDESGVYTVDGKDYQIIKGVASGPKDTNSYEDFNSVYYYSDGYFAEDENTYNKHLASMSLNLEVAGFNSNKCNVSPFNNSIEQNDYSEKFNNIQQILGDIGCQNIYVNDYMTVQPTKDSIGVTIANKKIEIDGEQRYLIPIVVRGSGYEREWIANMTLNYEDNKSAEAYGFSNPASKVLKEVDDYINAYGLKNEVDNGKVIFWPVGYSRGGAVANITAKNLIEKYVYKNNSRTGNKVFAYTFEAPQGGADSAEKLSDKTSYYCIHNVINKADIVPLVGPTRMGLKRYGVDHYIPGGDAGEVTVTTKTVSGAYAGNNTVTTYSDNSNYVVSKDTNSNYYKEKTKMIPQLASMTKDITFDDYFKQAELNILKAKLVWDQLEEKDSNLTQEEFLEDFIDKLQRYNDGKDNYAFYRRSNYSQNYNTEDDYDIKRSFQSVLQDLFGIFYFKSDVEMAGIKASMQDIPNRIDTWNWFWDEEDISLIDIYNNVIGNWNELGVGEKIHYTEFFWKIFTKDGGIDNVKNYLSNEELTELYDDWYKLLDTTFTFLAADYKNDSLKLTGTFIYNSNNILQSHHPEVTLAWLRAEDNYYDNDLREYKINYVKPSTPKVYKVEDNTEIANNTTLNKETPIKLLTTAGNRNPTESSIVYFTLSVEGQDKPIVDNQLYRGQEINLKAINNDTTRYKITTYSSNSMKKSNTANFYITVAKPVKIIKNFKMFNSDTGEYEDVSKTEYAYAGDTILLSDEDNYGNNTFAYWEFNGNRIGTVDGSELTTYVVPEGYEEIVINAHYKEQVNSIDLKITNPVAGQELDAIGKIKINNTVKDVTIYWINNSNNKVTSGVAEYNTSYTMGAEVNSNIVSDDIMMFTKDTKVNIYNGDNKVGEGTVTYGTDGSLRVSHNAPKTQMESLQEKPQNLQDIVLTEVPDNYNTYLPAKVSVKTETGTKMVNITWQQDSTKTNTTREHNYIGTLDLDSANINNGEYTNKVTARIYVDETYGKTRCSAPVANLNSGTYNGEQKLELSVVENADIYYTITDNGVTPADPTSASTRYTSTIKLQEGKTYKVKAIAYPKDTINYYKSDVIEFNYTINQMYTLTIKTLDTGILGNNNVSEVAYTTEYLPGTEIKLTAPIIENEAFSHWEDNNGHKLENTNITITQDATYIAIYNPIITKLEIVIDKFGPKENLPSRVKTAKATITNQYNVEDYLADIQYNYNDEKVEYGKDYVGTITLTDAAKENLFYTISNDYELVVKDTDGNVYNAAIHQIGDKQFDVYYTFSFIPNYTGTKAFSDVVAPSRMSKEEIQERLPEYTQIYCEDDVMRNAKVTWEEITGYNPNLLEEQIIQINGVIQLPNGILNENELPLTTSIKVIIKRAATTEKPEFESLTGEYNGELIARINSEEGSTTYYTISNNGEAPENPTENSEIYKGGIELLQSDEQESIKYIIKAISVKDGKFNSAVSSETYTIVHKHTLTETEAVAPSCVSGGNNTYYTCTCGKVFKDASGTFETTVADETLPVDPDAHDWGAWTEVTPATETKEGEETRACKHNPAHKETRPIPKLSHIHELEKVEEVKPTCTKDGNNAYYICTCGRAYKDASGTIETTVEDETLPIDSDAHDWGAWIEVTPATENEEGEEIRACNHNLTHTQTRTIPKLSHIHELEKVKAVDPTCTREGNNTYYICTCGRAYKDALGTVETSIEEETIPATGHDWDEWVEVVPATVDTEGLKTRTCKNDSAHTEDKTTEKRVLEITDGNNKTYKLNSGSEIRMKCNGTLENFVKLTLDGKSIQSSNYEKESGSTVIKFKNTYLDSLDVGTYKIAFVYNDNRKAETDLTIVKGTDHTDTTGDDTQKDNVSPETSSDTKADSTDSTSQNTDKVTKTRKSIGTGDNIIMYVSLITISIIGLFGTIKFSKKKDKRK